VHVIDIVTPHACNVSIGVLTVYTMPLMEASLLVKMWLMPASPLMIICCAPAECVAQPRLPRPLPHAAVLYQLCYNSHLCKLCAAFCHRVHVVDTPRSDFKNANLCCTRLDLIFGCTAVTCVPPPSPPRSRSCTCPARH
jgi:hypothetical protein